MRQGRHSYSTVIRYPIAFSVLRVTVRIYLGLRCTVAKELFSILFHRKIAARSGEEKNQTSPDWRTPLTDDDHVPMT